MCKLKLERCQLTVTKCFFCFAHYRMDHLQSKLFHNMDILCPLRTVRTENQYSNTLICLAVADSAN